MANYSLFVQISYALGAGLIVFGIPSLAATLAMLGIIRHYEKAGR
jgi:hypothetical protein